ncbi:MAG: HAD family hydrolase [Microbacterium sp.]
MTSTIVFDFDGTLALGAGPVLAYARLIAPHVDDAYLGEVEAALTAFEAGESDYRDGYDTVATVALAHGASADVMDAAYAESRSLLGTPDAPVTTIPDLPGFLASLGDDTRLVLATNAPGVGIDRVLAEWGVADAFDELHFAVGKPVGLTALISAALELGPVLSVGDIVVNDLAPAIELGAHTALVGVTASRSDAPVTMRGETLHALRSDILAWAAAARTPVH